MTFLSPDEICKPSSKSGNGFILKDVPAESDSRKVADEDKSVTTDEKTLEVNVSQQSAARVATGTKRASTTTAIKSNLTGTVTHFDGRLLPI
jgi:hypothetical protein